MAGALPEGCKKALWCTGRHDVPAQCVTGAIAGRLSLTMAVAACRCCWCLPRMRCWQGWCCLGRQIRSRSGALPGWLLAAAAGEAACLSLPSTLWCPATLTFSVLCRNASRYTGAQFAAAAEELLETSNITALEEQVLSFLFSNAGSLKLLALLDDLMTMLKEVGAAVVWQHVCVPLY